MRPSTFDARGHALFRAALLAFVAPPFGCVSMPEPPPPPEDLSALAAQYERPSAVVPTELVQRFIDEGRKHAEFGELLNRLQFVRTAISDTSTGLEQSGNVADFLLQGTINATAACPGDGVPRLTDAGSNGMLRLQIGLEESRIRRGFAGRAEQCRLVVTYLLLPNQYVTITADVVGDLGGDVGIGEMVTSDILVKLTNVVGTAVSTRGTVDLSRNEYHFRLAAGDAFEVLFDPASFGLPNVGSVVFALRLDGSFVLRESRGEWTCGGGGQACALR
jgi:hypothetical protein